MTSFETIQTKQKSKDFCLFALIDPDEKNNLIDNGENIERTLLEKLNYFMNKKD